MCGWTAIGNEEKPKCAGHTAWKKKGMGYKNQKCLKQFGNLTDLKEKRLENEVY